MTFQLTIELVNDSGETLHYVPPSLPPQGFSFTTPPPASLPASNGSGTAVALGSTDSFTVPLTYGHGEEMTHDITVMVNGGKVSFSPADYANGKLDSDQPGAATVTVAFTREPDSALG